MIALVQGKKTRGSLACAAPPICSFAREFICSDAVFLQDCWGAVSEGGKDFISALLKLDPMDRLTAEQALRHRWLEQSDDKTAGGGHDDLSLSLVRTQQPEVAEGSKESGGADGVYSLSCMAVVV